jgi:hypothetical protein
MATGVIRPSDLHVIELHEVVWINGDPANDSCPHSHLKPHGSGQKVRCVRSGIIQAAFGWMRAKSENGAKTVSGTVSPIADRIR